MNQGFFFIFGKMIIGGKVPIFGNWGRIGDEKLFEAFKWFL
ncbi:hypothetical protein SAMN05216378_3327 [Paenibacillus catalpae]|uniref:Uncharacterized protein n=1 Tax=Paenibacillus catalpae TaxID=1045775 RepID=A0A1I2B0I9_9BACL|nr:hypothetical protein SAMN05216378_3327 [Paenibacillus catalpae]